MGSNQGLALRMSHAALSAVILGLALLLFVSERVRHDLVALLALFACLAAGLVTPRQALLGFADPAVIAVAAVLVVGRAVELTGVAGAVTRVLVPRDASFALQLAVLMATGAALSAFMNNIAALVITMPLATEIARRAKLPPGAALMPLSFATILGGMTTLIGTPANLILSSVREEELGTPFGFFSMTGVGAAVTAGGLVYLAVLGWRLIPLRKSDNGGARPWRVFELELPEDGTEPGLVHRAAPRARTSAGPLSCRRPAGLIRTRDGGRSSVASFPQQPMGRGRSGGSCVYRGDAACRRRDRPGRRRPRVTPHW